MANKDDQMHAPDEDEVQGAEEMEAAAEASGIRKAVGDSRSRTMLLVLGGVAVVGALMFVMFSGGNKHPLPVTTIAAPVDAQQVPLGHEDPNLTALTLQQEQQQAAAALANGGTSMPAIKNTGSVTQQPMAVPMVPPNARLAPEPSPQLQPDRPVELSQNTSDSTQNADQQSRQQAMQAEILQIMQSAKNGPQETFDFSHDKMTADASDALTGSSTQISGTPSSVAPATPTTPATVKKVVIHATDVMYGVLNIEADSDVPGPILATVVGGKYDGAQVLGKFEVHNDYQVLIFNKLALHGVTLTINAVAIDPSDSGKIGFASSVDHRYMERFGGLFVASFIKGAGEAYATAQTVSGATSTLVPNAGEQTTNPELSTGTIAGIAAAKGASETASAVSQLMLQNASKIPVRVVVNQGTEMGLLFLDDVTE